MDELSEEEVYGEIFEQLNDNKSTLLSEWIGGMGEGRGRRPGGKE